MKSNSRRVIVARVTVLVGVFGTWEALSGGLGTGWEILHPLLFSSPSRVALDLYRIFSEGLLWSDLAVTLQEAFLGLALGMLTGLAVGLLCAFSPFTAQVLEPFMAAVNAIPRIALAPIFMLWLGVGPQSKVALAWVIVFFIVFYNTYQGVLSVDPDMIKAIRVAGGSSSQVVRIVILPSVASWAFAALRPSLGFALIAAVAGEFVGANKGLGYQLLIAQGLLLTERIYSILLILMVIGMIVSEGSRRIENRLLRWRPPVAF